MTIDKRRADALTDLLPCPFCGGRAEHDADDSGYHWIFCMGCGCSTDTDRRNDEDCRARLAAVWNARAASPVEKHGAALADAELDAAAQQYEGVPLDVARGLARAAILAAQPEPPAADERAAFVKYIGCDRPETEGVAVDAWDYHRKTWLAALAYARASSPNAAGAEDLAAIQAVLREVDPKWRERGEFGVKPHEQIIAAIRDLAAQPERSQAQTSRLKAIIDAIEGECDGLAIDENQAARILLYLDSTSPNGIVTAPAQAAEPVAWQFRVVSGGFDNPTDWHQCASKAHADEMRKPDYAGVIEVRDLFDTPPPPAPASAPVGLTGAARDVLAERRRQVEAEGWTPEHDDEHGDHAMSCAAGCCAMYTLAYPAGDPPPAWPWAADWWKPTTHRRNLTKAGALILAEIERLDRIATSAGDAL